MSFSYQFKRQLIVILVVVLFVGGIIGYWIYSNIESPSCVDKKQNQDEEEVDCGGKSCIPCASSIKDVVTLWKRFFVLREGFVDVAALVENPNPFLAGRELFYVIRLYDNDGVLIAAKENKTFIEPGEKMLIFEPHVAIQHGKPQRVDVAIRRVTWEKQESNVLELKVLRAEPLLDRDLPHIAARIKNESSAPYKNIEIGVAVLRGDEVVGVSRTIIDEINFNTERDIVFTWPEMIPGVTGVELYFHQIPQ